MSLNIHWELDIGYWKFPCPQPLMNYFYLIDLLLNNFSSRNEEILSEKLEKRRCLYANISGGAFIILQPKFQIAVEKIIKQQV